MHIAICMWGLLRSLRYTVSSINKYCLDPIVKAGHTYEIFMHTYRIPKEHQNIRNTSQRSNYPLRNLRLYDEIFNITDWKLLNPNYIFIEDQQIFDRSMIYDDYRQFGDPWRNGFRSQVNYLRALHSLNHLSLALEQAAKTKQIDRVVFLRPDVEIINELPVVLLEYHKDVLFVPDFHRSCDGGELNDRMAMGDFKSSLVYAKRFDEAKTYSHQKMLHAEKFTYDYLVETHQLRIIEIPFRFRRVRSNGDITDRDHGVITPAEQDAISPTGETPPITPWIIRRLFYGKNPDDPNNLYCSPNERISHQKLLMEYGDRYPVIKPLNDQLTNTQPVVSTDLMHDIGNKQISAESQYLEKSLEVILTPKLESSFGLDQNLIIMTIVCVTILIISFFRRRYIHSYCSSKGNN